MKVKHQMELSFGDLIKAVYQVWGSDRAEKMLQSAINTRQVIFPEQPLFLLSSAKEMSVFSKALQDGLDVIYARAARN
jgi:hypothetical protein